MIIEVKYKKGEKVWWISSDPFMLECIVKNLWFIGFTSNGEPEKLIYEIESLISGNKFNIQQQHLFDTKDACKDWFVNKGGYKTNQQKEPNFKKDR